MDMEERVSIASSPVDIGTRIPLVKHLNLDISSQTMGRTSLADPRTIFGWLVSWTSWTCTSRPVILNRGPHGPPGGNLPVLGGGGGIQSIWGIGEEWTPSGGINK